MERSWGLWNGIKIWARGQRLKAVIWTCVTAVFRGCNCGSPRERASCGGCKNGWQFREHKNTSGPIMEWRWTLNMIWFLYGSRDSSVGVVTSLRAGGSESRIPARALQLFLQKRPEGLCGQISLIFIGYSFSQGVKINHSPLSTTRVEKGWSYSSNPPYALMAWCVVISWKTGPQL